MRANERVGEPEVFGVFAVIFDVDDDFVAFEGGITVFERAPHKLAAFGVEEGGRQVGHVLEGVDEVTHGLVDCVDLRAEQRRVRGGVANDGGGFALNRGRAQKLTLGQCGAVGVEHFRGVGVGAGFGFWRLRRLAFGRGVRLSSVTAGTRSETRDENGGA